MSSHMCWQGVKYLEISRSVVIYKHQSLMHRVYQLFSNICDDWWTILGGYFIVILKWTFDKFYSCRVELYIYFFKFFSKYNWFSIYCGYHSENRPFIKDLQRFFTTTSSAWKSTFMLHRTNAKWITLRKVP